ncbi:MAG: sensor histidine kinase, partial [Longimicrobiales bacterium]
TPINAIIGYTEILDMGIGGELSEEQRHHVDRVRGSSRHLLTLINDVLDLARIEAGHMTVEHSKWRVRPAIADALALLALQAEERTVHLVDDCRDRELSYFGDQDRVRQILANLLSNAVKFTAAGGTITVRCGSTDEPAPEAHLDADGTWAFIQVEDTGVGMTPAEAATVFQPFVQAAAGRTRSHGGTGLGLTIGRQLARLMGGDLTLRSEPGVGTCVTLWLSGQRARSGVLDESIRVNAV